MLTIHGSRLCLGLALACLGLELLTPSIHAADSGNIKVLTAETLHRAYLLHPSTSNVTPGLMDETLAALKRRLRDYTCAIEPRGESVVSVRVIDIPAAEQSRVRDLLILPGRLDLCMVHPSNDVYVVSGLTPPGYKILTMSGTVMPGGLTPEISYVVKSTPEPGLAGAAIRHASVSRDPVSNQPQIMFEFESEAAEAFERLTTTYQPYASPNGQAYHQAAIILDGRLQSAPRIQEPIRGGRGVISGSFDVMEAQLLVLLMENSLPVALQMIQEEGLDAAQAASIRRIKYTSLLKNPWVLGATGFLIIFLIFFITLLRSAARKQQLARIAGNQL